MTKPVEHVVYKILRIPESHQDMQDVPQQYKSLFITTND